MQNGLEHSGRKGPIDWDKGDNVQRTIDVLYALAQRLNGVNGAPETAGVVEGIELLNGPYGLLGDRYVCAFVTLTCSCQ